MERENDKSFVSLLITIIAITKARHIAANKNCLYIMPQACMKIASLKYC